jgi:hypothetical protein
MNFAKSVLAIAAMALACGGAFAADDKQRKGFNDMDKNGDGKLSRAEAAGNKDLLARWKEADGDNDGMLSRVEYLKVAAKQDVNTVREKVAGKDDKQQKTAAAKNDKGRKGFNDMDKNSDGKLSRTEAAGNKTLLAKWKELDTDGDGSLSRAEYLKEMAKQDANTVKNKVSKETNEAKRRAPDASTGATSQNKSK